MKLQKTVMITGTAISIFLLILYLSGMKGLSPGWVAVPFTVCVAIGLLVPVFAPKKKASAPSRKAESISRKAGMVTERTVYVQPTAEKKKKIKDWKDLQKEVEETAVFIAGKSGWTPSSLEKDIFCFCIAYAVESGMAKAEFFGDTKKLFKGNRYSADICQMPVMKALNDMDYEWQEGESISESQAFKNIFRVRDTFNCSKIYLAEIAKADSSSVAFSKMDVYMHVGTFIQDEAKKE